VSYGNRDNQLSLSEEEAELAREVARRKGITESEAASLILKGGIERRVRKRTGKAKAKVYGIRGGK
jgi:hypothetical protein